MNWSSGVQLLLVCSLHFLAMVWRRIINSVGGGYISIWYKRLAKLLIPLIIGTLLFLAILVITGEYDYSQIVSDLKDGLMPLPFSWFCYVIFLLYLGFYLIYSLKFSLILKLLLLAFYVLAVIVFLRMVLGFGSHWYISNLTFVLGAVIGSLQENRIIEYVNRVRVILGIGVIICTFTSMLWFKFAPQYGLPQMFVVFITVLPVVVILLSYMFFHTASMLSLLGKISYEVYLVHGIIIWALLRYQLTVLIYVISVLALAILGGYVGNKLNKAIYKTIRL